MENSATKPAQSGINDFVNAKLAETTGPAGKKDVERFIIELKPETRTLLNAICDELGAKKIAFASQVFEIALKDAAKAVKAAKAAAEQAARTPTPVAK